MGNCRYRETRCATLKGGMDANPPWEGPLQELPCAEEAQSDGTLAASLQEGAGGKEAAANSRGNAESEASSPHIAMLGAAGGCWLAIHIWHSSLRSPP